MKRIFYPLFAHERDNYQGKYFDTLHEAEENAKQILKQKSKSFEPFIKATIYARVESGFISTEFIVKEILP